MLCTPPQLFTPGVCPMQNQKWLSDCLRRRHPLSLTLPEKPILSTMDMSQPGPKQGGPPLVVELKFTQASTVKSPEDTCKLDAFPKSTKALLPFREKATPTSPG